ncbi:MAG: hypothetical protein J0M03_00595 [Acidobacteria bacterium]|nr:hypothetical protein [Acidobacteriota bacterium]
MFYLLNFLINSKTCSLFLSFLLILFPAFNQQGKDHLNEQEVERVREAQLIDLRAKVFLHIAERRLNVILGLAPTSFNEKDEKDGKDKKKDKKKKEEKEEKEEKEKLDKYGPEPSGTTAQLLDNYTKVISELLDKLDDVYEKKKDDPAFSKAIDKIIDKSQDHLKLLEKISSKVNSPDEERALGKAVETIETALTGARSFKSASK